LIEQYVRVNEQIADHLQPKPALSENEIDVLKKKLRTRSVKRHKKNSTA
jgi:hypothetical protein